MLFSQGWPKTLLKWKININKIARKATTHSEELSFPKYVARIIKLYKIAQQFCHRIDQKNGKKQANNCGA